MKMITKTLLCLSVAALMPVGASAKVVTGSMAPDVEVTDSNGKVRKLSEFRGKNVVLEWTNHGCPFVKKHYSGGNMQGLQKDARADDVVWLSVVSSAPGKQGHITAAQANELTATRGAAPSAVLLDESGAKGRAYAAKTTPHMYVVDKKGTLVYQGAIDSDSSIRRSSIDGATNYVSAALASLKVGSPIAQAETKPYGCSVKYN